MIIRPKWNLVAVAAAASSLATWALVSQPSGADRVRSQSVEQVVATARSADGLSIGGKGACPGESATVPSVTVFDGPIASTQPQGRTEASGLQPSLGGIALGPSQTPRDRTDENAHIAQALHSALTAEAAAVVMGMGGQPTAGHALTVLVAALNPSQECESSDEGPPMAEEDELESHAAPMEESGEPDASELVELTRTLEKDPANVTALNNLAILYSRKPEMAAFSEALFGLLESLDPKDPAVRSNLQAYRDHRAGAGSALEFGRQGTLLTLATKGPSHAVASRGTH